jgi:hypothetical protein
MDGAEVMEDTAARYPQIRARINQEAFLLGNYGLGLPEWAEAI